MGWGGEEGVRLQGERTDVLRRDGLSGSGVGWDEVGAERKNEVPSFSP